MMKFESRTAGIRWRPATTTIVSGILVGAGFLLTGVSWWFLLLTAAGTFGPGILREMGWLRDKDEFQRRAAHHAGYHAFVTAGVVAFVLVAYIRSGERLLEDAEELSTLFLALLWFTWFLSSLLAYWGPQETASRILYAFGSAWLVFAILSNVGSEWTGWLALLLHPLLAAPFFILGWCACRWPRVAGLVLLLASGFFFRFFGFWQGDLNRVNDGVTFILFIGPLLASALALLAMRTEEEEEEDDDLEDVAVVGS